VGSIKTPLGMNRVTTLQLQSFYGSSGFAWDYPGKPVPERYNWEHKTNLDLLEQETVSRSGICTSSHTDNHVSTPPLSFLQARFTKYLTIYHNIINQATKYASQHIWCLSQARIN